MLADPVREELNWRAVAQRGVAATPVVEDLDVLEQIGLRVGFRRVGRAMHPLVLQAVEEAFGGRVVPSVALAAHRGRHAVLGELGGHGVAGVLAAAVAVEDHPGIGLAPEPWTSAPARF